MLWFETGTKLCVWTHVRLLSSSRVPHTELDWMAPIERRVQTFARSAALALCGDAFARGDAEEAPSYVKRLIDEDPCDERARSRAVREELGIDPASEQDDALDAITDGVQPEPLSRPAEAVTSLPY